MISRCPWCKSDPLYVQYHDEEWGKPVHEDRVLFEFLILEGMQAGLSWLTILRRREGYREAFLNFDPKKVALFGAAELEALVQNPKIIRHRGKIRAAINNAHRFLSVQQEFGSFDRYLWQFTEGKTIQNRWERHEEVPCQTAISDKMAKDLKKRGFQFVGTKICYSLMQAIGMVNDHLISCDQHSLK